jgi:hypothetical protein
VASTPAQPEFEDATMLNDPLDNTQNETEDVIHASDRIALQLSYRSEDDDRCLLSTNPADEERYDVYKTSYADLLYRYGAVDLRTEVLKTVSKDESDHQGVTFGLLCRSCQQVRCVQYVSLRIIVAIQTD